MVVTKKHFGLFSCVLFFLFFSCEKPGRSESRIIVTSIYPVYLATLNITASVPDLVVERLVEFHTGCPHDYHLTPHDAARLEEASVLVISGAGIETFLERTISGSEGLVVIDASSGLISGSDSAKFGDSGHDSYHHCSFDTLHSHNPHVWLSVTKKNGTGEHYCCGSWGLGQKK